MKKNLYKLIWFGFPLTKLVYAYLAYTQNKEINNSLELINLLFMLIGITTCLISIIFSKKIFQKNFYESKIIKAFMGNKNADDIYSKFPLYTMMLGLAESAALFGFVQFIITGNLITGAMLFALCFIAWLFNYPSNIESEEE